MEIQEDRRSKKDRRINYIKEKIDFDNLMPNIKMVISTIILGGIFVMIFSNQAKLSQTQINIVNTLENIQHSNNTHEDQIKKIETYYSDNLKRTREDVNKLNNLVEIKFNNLENKIEFIYNRIDILKDKND